MKRKTKLLSLLLAVCVIFGVAVIGAQAVTSSDELDAAFYESQLKPDGATNYFAYPNHSSSWGIATSVTPNGAAAKTTVNGNTYTSIHYKNGGDFAKAGGGYYTMKAGSASKIIRDYGFVFNGAIEHAAIVFDMDIAPDRYTVTSVENGVTTYKTYTPDELAEAGLTPKSEGVDISYANGDRFYLSYRYTPDTLASKTTEVTNLQNASTSIYYLKDTDGTWYYGNGTTLGNSTYKVKVSGVGIFDHVTAVMYPTLVKSGDTTYTTLTSVVYINGEIVYNKCVIDSSKKALSTWMDEFRINVDAAAKDKLDSYSYAVDNYTLNYYGADYVSEDGGLTSLIKSGNFTNGAILDCYDVVGNKNYVSPNGYVQIKRESGNRDLVSIPYAVNEELALLENGDTLYTTMNLNNLDIPASVSSLFIECDNEKVSVTPSSELLKRGYMVRKVEGGYSVEICEDLVIVKVMDACGNLIYEKTLGYGFAPELDGINPSGVANGVIKYTTSPEWEWSLGGEIGIVDTTMATPGTVITITPKESCMTVVNGATFAMGSYDENYRFIPAPASDGTYTAYVNATGDFFINEFASASNGNVAILLADFTGIEGDAAAVTGIGAKTLKSYKSYRLDLNGHKLVKMGVNASDQAPFFTVHEGTSLSVYSSKEGGELLIGTARVDSASVLNQIRSCGFYIKSGIDAGELNVGALVDENGKTIFNGDNLTFTGGSLVIYAGGTESGGGKIRINVIGGSYFVAFRGSYSFITLQGPDAVINVDGIELYGTYSSTSLVHEYLNKVTTGTEVTVRNSELYCAHLFNRVGVGSYYLANNTIAGTSKIVNTNGGASIVVGPGNKFAGRSMSEFFDLDNVTLEKGVVMLYPDADNAALGKINKDFVHSTAELAWANTLDVVLKEGANIEGAIDTLAEAAFVESVMFKDSVIENTKTTNLSYDCYSVTFSADNIPSGVSVIEWQDESGKVLSTTYQFTGESVSAPAECVSYEKALDWCVERFSWKSIESVSAGKTVVKPEKELVGKISGILQNATLFSDMTYNLYLPVSDKVTELSVSGAEIKGIVTVLDGEYYLISATPAVNDFAPISATVSYKYDGAALTYDVTLDIVAYASAVAKQYICGSEEAILVYEILAYKSAVAKYVDPSFAASGSLAAYIEDHSKCNCKAIEASFSSAELNVSYDALKNEGVSAIAYSLSIPNIGMAIYVEDGAVVSSVSYVDALGREHVHSVDAGNLEKRSGYYIATGLSAAYIDNVMTITVNGVEGTYSLAKYIKNATDESAKAVATALYTYAVAADNFKTITTTEHKFTISFDTNGGDPISPIKVLGGQLIPVPENATRLAYKLVEWQLEGEKYDFNTPVTADITLTAVWERAEDNEVYEGMQSVLLIGQSNMVGIGPLSAVEPIDDDRLFMMRNDRWVKMEEPLHTNSDRAGAGIGASFGKAFVETFGCNVGLIPAAEGSTTLEDWKVGGRLYTEAVRLAKIAQENSNIAAILWHQGEGDQNNSNYAKLLKVILDSMLEELGLDPNKIVIVTGELFGTRSDAVHMEQLIKLGESYPNYAIALSDNLTVVDVTTHFDAPSTRVFGYRYFAHFYKIITGKTYVYDDDPTNYWISQIPSTEFTYAPFDDMITGVVGSGYFGNVMLEIGGEKGVVSVKKGDGTNKYLIVNNYVTTDKIYASVYVDSLNNAKNLGYGGVVAVQADIKLGSNHNCDASIFTVYTENSEAVYSNFYLDASGNLSVVDASGNKTNIMKLTTTDWVSIMVVLDTERNLKDIYVNGEIVLRGVKISNDVDPSKLAIDYTRLIEFADSDANKGSVLFDEYRFYPYSDNLQPGE